MSFPEYKDFDRSCRDALEEGFDTSYGLEVNATGPFGVNLTSATSACCGASEFPSTVKLNYSDPCGFNIDKLEVASMDSIVFESSFEPKGVPGAKVGFASSNNGGGTLGVVYKHKLATITTDLDVGGFSSIQSSVLGGMHGFQAGAAVELSLINKDQLSNYSAAFGWVPKEGLFTGLQANDKFGAVTTSLQYQATPKVNIAALVDFSPKALAESLKVSVGAEYAHCEGIIVKGKTSNDGIINASIKKTLKNCSVTGAVELNAKDMKSFNFGATATVG